MASCSGYAGEPQSFVDAQTGESLSYSTTFSAAALPTPAGLASDVAFDEGAEASQFLSFLAGGLLQKANVQGKCGSCWAFGIAQSLQYATALAYRRLHRFFRPRYMSVQYLLSCYEKQDVMCGCRGGDLAEAFKVVASGGTVLEQDFRYDNGEDPRQSVASGDVICAQNAGHFLGTCRPCGSSEEPVREGTTISCIPCGGQPLWPRYYPSRPFRVSSQASPLDQRVRAIKQELRRVGPLCGVLGVDREAFQALHGFNGRVVERVTEAPVYAPATVSKTAVKHAVLIVGYYDPWARDKRTEGLRSQAVWVCRNSWGGDWGYRIRATRIEDGGDGATAHLVRTALGGFFNVSMYEHADAIQLVNQTVSFQEVMVQFEEDPNPRALRASDLHTAPLPDLSGLPNGASLGGADVLLTPLLGVLTPDRTISGRRRASGLLILFVALVVAVVIIWK